MSVRSLLSYVQLIISNLGIPPYSDARLFCIVSLGLLLPLCPSNFPVGMTVYGLLWSKLSLFNSIKT